MFRLIRDEDFQTLLGLASEAKRLQGGLSAMVHAANVIREQPSSASATELLLHLATQNGGLGSGIGTGAPDTAPVPDNDEVINDATELRRQVNRR